MFVKLMSALERFPSEKLWLSMVALSVVLTEVIVAPMEWLLLGRITADYLLTGLVASVLVASLVVAIIQSASEQTRRLAANLADSETKFRMLFETANDGIFLQDATGFLDCNQKGASMYGLAKEDVIGKSPADFCPERQPDGRLSSEVVAEKIAAAMAGETPCFEWQPLRADGVPFDVELTLNRVEYRGAQCLQSIVRDISKRKEVERQFQREHAFRQKIIESLPGVFYVFDASGHFHSWNHNLEEVVGRSAEEIDKLHPLDLFDAENKPLVAEAIQRAFSTGRSTVEARMLAKDGQRIPYLFSGISADLDGQPTVIGLGIDITERNQTEENLRESKERWEFALEGAGDGVWDWNIKTGQATYSKRWKEILGFSESEIRNSSSEWSDRVHPEDMSNVMKAIQAHIDGKTPSALIEHRMLCKDGSWKWILGRGMVVSHDSDGKPLRLVGTNTDITERKAVEVRDQLLVAALEAVGEGVVITDAKAKIEWANTAFETLTGYTREKAVGSRLAELVKSGLQDQPFYEAMWRTILDGAHWRGELVNKRKDGSLYHEELAIAPVKSVMGEIGHFVGVKRDISERKRLEAELHEMATTDLLTGLPNRRHFMARLEEELARVLRLEHQLAAVLMIDLDHFKQVNDNFGHAVGDSVLRHFAALMREGLRKIDTGGRIGGEEFAIILPGADGDAARTFAERLRHKTEQTPLTLASQTTIPLTVSIGIAAIDAADASPDAALVRADEALYRAKSMGRNRVVGYKLSVTDVVPLN